MHKEGSRQPGPHAETAFWDERYSNSEKLWSGNPNSVLVREIESLVPGRALDVGCGEGADAIWLAKRGWQVTAIDVSAVALERASAAAKAQGIEVTWVHAGLLDAPLPQEEFDLVSSQYAAIRRTPSHEAERALIAAVAPGGILLVVHHTFADHLHEGDLDWDPTDFVVPLDVASLLGEGWEVALSERVPREVHEGAGAHHKFDLIVSARRTR